MNTQQPIAVKFVRWEVPTLDTLANSKVYNLREKLNRGEKMSREEKNWLTDNLNHNSYFRTAIPLSGYRFDFSDVIRKFLVNQYGHWNEYYAPDKTSLSTVLYGRVNQIVAI